MIELFQEWYNNHHEYAKAWKQKTGGKILGYFCPQVPEEILYAAEILPVCLPVSHEPRTMTEQHLSGKDCPLCRECLTQGLPDGYDYLDGVMISPSCPPIPEAIAPGLLHLPAPSCYFPSWHPIQNPRTGPGLTAELAEFKKSVEEWTGQEITDADLDRGIEILNESRRLMRQAFETRKKDNPPLTGLEVMYLRVSSQWIDKRQHNRILEDVLEKELPTRDLRLGGQIRLMILNSEDGDTEFVKMLESLDATFVIDDHCIGSRYFWNEVLPTADRLTAIAASYLDRLAYPCKDWPLSRRLDHLLKRVKDWRVQGVIIIQQKFCDPPESDIPSLSQALDGVGVSSLILEPELSLSQSKIRVAAFLEMLRPEDLF